MAVENDARITFARCRTCGAQYFPLRLICRACGTDEFDHFVPETGEVEEATSLADGTHILSVRAHGVRIVCAADVLVRPGSTVVINDALMSGTDVPRVRVPGMQTIENEEAV